MPQVFFSFDSRCLTVRFWFMKFKSGVLFGEDVQKLYKYANDHQFAIPAVNVVGTNSINGVLETAKKLNSPVIIQFSHGGATFYAGKSLPNDKHEAAIAGAISGAHHVHLMAKLYDIPVILHTDHAAKKLLPWIDGLLDASEEHFKKNGNPLYSSHMLDLSEEPLHENIELSKTYFKRVGFDTIAVAFEFKHIWNGGSPFFLFLNESVPCLTKPCNQYFKSNAST